MGKRTFKEFMEEEKLINRWTILIVAITGAFCGALLAVGFLLMGLV